MSGEPTIMRHLFAKQLLEQLGLLHVEIAGDVAEDRFEGSDPHLSVRGYSHVMLRTHPSGG